MKILFVIDGLRAGGKERQLLELMKGLAFRENIIYELILTNKNIQYKEFFSLNIKTHYLVRGKILDLEIISRISKIVKDFKPDIIHSWCNLCTFFAIPAAKLNGTILIDGSIRYAAPIRIFSKIWIISKINFIFSNKIVANSYAGLKTHKLNESDKNLCIHNGFDFSRLENLSSTGLTKIKYDINTKYIVGMVARFGGLKDYFVYIKAALKIMDRRNDITFLCVGDGPNRKMVESMVPIKSKTKILFSGRINNIEDIVSIFDVCILTNNTKGHAEGISNSIMEYMSLGKPVIATKAGGNTELIIDKVTGFLIKPFDAVVLAEKIEILLADKQLRTKMGHSGKERLKQYFSMNMMVEKYIDLYKKTINEN
tara:strand:- start:354 stop:1460 length:1107 start_codon:yes stop_codon:yes gene_type:complete